MAHTNTVTVLEPKETVNPTVGTIPVGSMFKLIEDSNVVYMKTYRSVGAQTDCVHLGTGALYAIADYKVVKRIYRIQLAFRECDHAVQ